MSSVAVPFGPAGAQHIGAGLFVCLYLTDMECSRYPETEPGFDVLWVNHGDPPGDWNREPWGERIDIGAE